MKVIEMKINQISKAHRIEVYKSLMIILAFPSFQILQIQKTSTLSTKTLNLQNHILKGTTIYIFLYLHCCFFLFWSSPHTVSSTPLKHQTEKKHVNKHQKNVTSYEMEEEKNHQATSIALSPFQLLHQFCNIQNHSPSTYISKTMEEILYSKTQLVPV